MKSILLPFILFFLPLCVYAQNNEHMHIYRNDHNFSTVKSAEIDNIIFDGTTPEGRMIVLRHDGSSEIHPMTAVDSCVLRQTDLPEISITLLDHPEWTELKGAKSDVHPALLSMAGNGMFDDIDEQEVEFRGRGNSTWDFPKKPYRFKMAKKKSVCGLPKAKSYALIANYIDCSLMRNAVAMWIARYLEMPFTNHTIPVKVCLNGVNKGQYVLTEKIGIGSGSVDIDESTGMLFELDTNFDEKYQFHYSWTAGGRTLTIPVMVKDPDLDELAEDSDIPAITDAEEYFRLWKEDFCAMADAVVSRDPSLRLDDVLDMESVVNYFLVNTLTGNMEMGHPKSVFVYKRSLARGELYHFGPVWDFDWAYNFPEISPDCTIIDSDGSENGSSFMRHLAANHEFRMLFEAKMNDFAANGLPLLLNFINEYAGLIEPSALENGLLWPESYIYGEFKVESSFEAQRHAAQLKDWLVQHIEFMQHHRNFGIY